MLGDAPRNRFFLFRTRRSARSLSIEDGFALIRAYFLTAVPPITAPIQPVTLQVVPLSG